MPLPELLAALEREAATTEAALLEHARVEAERLQAAAAGEGTARLTERLAEHARALRGRAEEKLVGARRTSEASVLQARKEFLDRVYHGALGLQGEARTWKAYQTALERDVRSLLALIAGEEAIVRCASADLATVASTAGSGVRVEASPELVSGVRVGTADGRLEMDRSLSAHLAGAWPALAIALVQKLEGAR